METYEDSELQQRLGLYQVFCKLYEHRRELLDEILRLETSSSRALSHIKLPYIQGMMLNQPYLISNLLQGKTQALMQLNGQWIIGRNPQQSTIPIADQRLSRVHAAIEFVAQQGFYLTDLSSSNGTFVNGESIHQPVLLKDGDRIRLGSVSFVFFLCASVTVLRSAMPASNRDQSIDSQQLQSRIAHSPFSITSGTGCVSEIVSIESDHPPSSNPLEETFSFIR